jgi:S-DNA-T family DNA segregation ATPase FtsK/SpoIIIE
MACATSSTSPIRRAGTWAAAAAWKSSNVRPSRAAVAAVMSVAMKPGATALAVMPIGTKHIGEIAAPFEAIATIIRWTTIAMSVSYGPVLLALSWIAMGALWWTGRAHANANLTGWLALPRNDDVTGLVVTADTIVLALQNLPNLAMRRAFRAGWRPTFYTMPVRDGRGYSALFSLALGVTADMIADQRPVLARNVHRAEVEVWPSDAEQTGTGPTPLPCGLPTRASCPSLLRNTR